MPCRPLSPSSQTLPNLFVPSKKKVSGVVALVALVAGGVLIGVGVRYLKGSGAIASVSAGGLSLLGFGASSLYLIILSCKKESTSKKKAPKEKNAAPKKDEAKIPQKKSQEGPTKAAEKKASDPKIKKSIAQNTGKKKPKAPISDKKTIEPLISKGLNQNSSAEKVPEPDEPEVKEYVNLILGWLKRPENYPWTGTWVGYKSVLDFQEIRKEFKETQSGKAIVGQIKEGTKPLDVIREIELKAMSHLTDHKICSFYGKKYSSKLSKDETSLCMSADAYFLPPELPDDQIEFLVGHLTEKLATANKNDHFFTLKGSEINLMLQSFNKIFNTQVSLAKFLPYLSRASLKLFGESEFGKIQYDSNYTSIKYPLSSIEKKMLNTKG